MNAPIKTAPDLANAILSTYLFDVALAVVFLALMILVANMIKWQSGKNDKSGTVRRVWFFVFCFLSFIVAFVLNWLMFSQRITVDAFANKYMTHMILGAFVAAVVYFLTGFAIVKMARVGTKLESIFPKKA